MITEEGLSVESSCSGSQPTLFPLPPCSPSDGTLMADEHFVFIKPPMGGFVLLGRRVLSENRNLLKGLL